MPLTLEQIVEIPVPPGGEAVAQVQTIVSQVTVLQHTEEQFMEIPVPSVAVAVAQVPKIVSLMGVIQRTGEQCMGVPMLLDVACVRTRVGWIGLCNVGVSAQRGNV